MREMMKTRATRFLTILLGALVLLANYSLPSLAVTSESNHIVVSLGDSYSSGEGCPKFYGQDNKKIEHEDWLAHRSENSWEGQLVVKNTKLRDVKCSQVLNGKIPESDTRWYFYASSGAVAVNVYSDRKEGDEYVDAQDKPVEMRHAAPYSLLMVDRTNLVRAKPKVQVQLIEAMSDLDRDGLNGADVDYVTISIGGNDIGFSDIVSDVAWKDIIDRDYLFNSLNKAWIKYDNKPRHPGAKTDFELAPGEALKKDLIADCYKTICKTFPNAEVIVVGYPTLMNDNKWELYRQSQGVFDRLIRWFDADLSDHVGFADWEAFAVNRDARMFNKCLEHQVSECNKQLRREGADHDRLHFVSVLEGDYSFDGHEAYTDEPFLNPIMLTQSEDLTFLPIPISSYSFHPNYKGKKAASDNDTKPHDGISCYCGAVQIELDKLAKGQPTSDHTERPKPTVEPKPSAKQAPTEKRSIAMVLDVSGSMEGEPLNETKRAAQQFVDNALSSNVQLGLVTFESSASMASGLGSSSEMLKSTIGELTSGGGTNIEEGLSYGSSMVYGDSSNKRIIVLMSDGDPTDGRSGEDLVSYARSIRDSNGDGKEDVKIYTLGFNLSAYGQYLLANIASQGCHYEVQESSDLSDFFIDISDEIAGTRFIYARIECPVDVTVTSGGETLSSAGDTPKTRTSFGSLTFEQELDDDGFAREEDPVKVLRLREGTDYDIHIEGYDIGTMDYSIGFVGEDGDYDDFRTFSDIGITDRSIITTEAKVSDETTMLIDNNGDGRIDTRLRAVANQEAEPVNNGWIFWLVLVDLVLVWLLIALLAIRRTIRNLYNPIRA